MLLGVLFFFTSCMDTYNVTKRSTYEKSVQSIRSQMAINGFSSTGVSTSTRNETVVTGTSYSKYTGYGTRMENNYITQDTYQFTDTLGNTMSYSVSYSAKQTEGGISYVENVELCGCETSNPKDYERFCGVGSTVRRINNLPKDQEIEKVNMLNTTLAISAIIIPLSFIVTWLAFKTI